MSQERTGKVRGQPLTVVTEGALSEGSLEGARAQQVDFSATASKTTGD